MKLIRCLLGVLGMMAIPQGAVLADEAPPSGGVPQAIQQLRDREARVKETVKRVLPCVVAVTSADENRQGSGSGVIVSRDGLILTAAHVTQATGNDLVIILPDGRRLKGTSLGANRTTDAGMAKITEGGDWPFVEMGNSDLLKLGDWVIAMGHPGGFSFERQPPVRLGRVWRRDLDGALFTSCPLIGGDSGGPLFDMEGRVVGIHSSIHGSVEMNRHVALDTLRFDWDKLLKDQTWGQVSFNAGVETRPITGALFDHESRAGVLVKEVFADLPASRAGIRPGDVVKKFDGEEVTTYHAMQRLIGRRKPGDVVPLAVQRGGELVDLKLELGRRFAPAGDGQGRGSDDGEEDTAPRRLPREPETEPAGTRPHLGAALEAGSGGVRLQQLEAEGPAAKSGLKEGDVIIRINGTEVADTAQAAETLLELPPESSATLLVRRGQEELTLEVRLGRK